MATRDVHIQKLLQCIALEEKEEINRYRLDEQHSLKSLKAEGLALHPLSVVRKTFGYADYPEIGFRLRFPAETQLFKDGAAIECFFPGEEPVKGVLINIDGRQGEFRLFAPDFPDWIEDEGVGIKLAPDLRTNSLMKKALEQLESRKELFRLFQQMHGELASTAKADVAAALSNMQFYNNNLNHSQRQAVAAVLAGQEMTILHGPPGTGKTTTLAEAIRQLVSRGEKVLVSAASNAAVDHIAAALLAAGIKILRLGNAGKASTLVYAHTPEGRLAQSGQQKEIKEMRIRAEAFRKMAHKYKRSFGKAEREQRNLLFKEVKDLRTAIKKLQAYNEEKLLGDAEAILGTPVALYDAALQHIKFETLVIDEAGQCIEPLAWCIFSLAQKYVLAGDHLQLPPTVLSNEAAGLGLNRSILEQAVTHFRNVFLLDTQYRMRQAIAGFSGNYFYNDLLLTAPHLANEGEHVIFVDTAGSGFEEKTAADGSSLQNDGELKIAQQILQEENIDVAQVAFISPYAGQVVAAKEMLPAGLRISTIDSFQGQEYHAIIVSLVRSNDEGNIGFLKDYRRMNVAITRAKEKLIVIGDSATIGGDSFYLSFLNYVAQHGTHRSVWEFDIV